MSYELKMQGVGNGKRSDIEAYKKRNINYEIKKICEY